MPARGENNLVVWDEAKIAAFDLHARVDKLDIAAHRLALSSLKGAGVERPKPGNYFAPEHLGLVDVTTVFRELTWKACKRVVVLANQARARQAVEETAARAGWTAEVEVELT